MPSIVTISGTSRPDNFTSRALRVVEQQLADKGVEPSRFDARELQLNFPGQPVTEDAKRLTAAVKSASAVILATPEYHGSFCAMTKLILESMGFPSALQGKPVALVGVAAGRIGAVKSLEHLRGVCAHMGAIVMPGAISIAGVQACFDAEGVCTDEGAQRALSGVADSMLQFIHDYVCPREILEAAVREGASLPWTASV